MIKHIVMWQVEEHKDFGTKKEIMEKIKKELESLAGKIEGLMEIEVGININESSAAYDVVLYSTFEDIEALNYYQNHQLHKNIGTNLIKPVTTSRVVVDYTV